MTTNLSFSLNTPLSELKRITPAYIKNLKKLKIKTLGDLIYHFPNRYEDFSKILPIKDVFVGEVVTIQGKITDINLTRTWKRKIYITEIEIKDETGSISAIWYNQPYLAQTFKPGLTISLSGKTSKEGKRVYLQNPSYELVRKENQFLAHTARLVAIYPETKGVTSRWLRFQLKQLLPFIKEIPEFLPQNIIRKNGLMPLALALNEIHFPNSREKIEHAKKRLGFDEIFFIQLFLATQRANLKKETSPAISFNQKIVKKFVDSLPFKLTQAQRKAAWEILQDLEKSHPMNRLLNGDVGTGKTLVASIASLQVAEKNHQVAFMAPTEVLAWQHFNTFYSLFQENNFGIVLATGSQNKFFNPTTKEIKEVTKKQIKEIVGNGRAQIIIGTHALIQEDSVFKNLALAIIDEQHRFGVAQRAKLASGQKLTPHLLTMTATPIPRTLTLAIYGDLDISILNEMPRGLRTVNTKIILPQQANQIYRFVAEQIIKGQQVFVVCPRIEEVKEEKIESEAIIKKLDMKAVDTEFEKLKKIFPKFNIAKLHGKMKSQEKTEVLEKMQRGKIDILVATSVIEVGIDVPKASILWIENAERFGLAQLHQFRGRIGRKGQQAWCFLFSNKDSSERLKAMVATNDGFKLAKKDLEIRGPGEFYGVQQWGFPDLTIGSLADYETVKLARDEALNLLKEDSELKKYPALKAKFSDFTKKIHLE
ncbi:ATP-dependent DNA helicase RecG [Candidatus Parcubacteria bacterium]|nr:MAG: ATP-dependent DNA helicase RecG [Candidatus Parcubacteria bacterium]